jgi:Aconitase A
MTGRTDERIALVEAYCKENMLWHDPDDQPTYTEVVELDLATVEPSIAGPRRPQDRVPLAAAKESFVDALGTFGVGYGNGTYDKEVADSFPASDVPTGDGVVERRRRRSRSPRRSTIASASATSSSTTARW